MDHRPHHHPVLLLRRLGRLRLRVQQRLLLKQILGKDAGLRVRVFCRLLIYQKFLKKLVTKTKIYRVDK